jgi:hypothetical protein
MRAPSFAYSKAGIVTVDRGGLFPGRDRPGPLSEDKKEAIPTDDFCDGIDTVLFLFERKEMEMASTQPVRVPERPAEPADNATISAAPRPLPAPRKARFTIKVKGMIPT